VYRTGRGVAKVQHLGGGEGGGGVCHMTMINFSNKNCQLFCISIKFSNQSYKQEDTLLQNTLINVKSNIIVVGKDVDQLWSADNKLPKFHHRHCLSISFDQQ
jgi:hypothetical protein